MNYIDLRDKAEKEVIPGFKAKFVHSANMTFAYWNIKSGSPMPNHSHMHEQVANVIEGQFELTVNGISHVMEPGTVMIIPSNAPHSGKALTDCIIIDVFYPIREDRVEK